MTFSDYLNILCESFNWEEAREHFPEKYIGKRKSGAKFTRILLTAGLKPDAACRTELMEYTDIYYRMIFAGNESPSGRDADSVLSRINLETDFDDFAFRDFIAEYFEQGFEKLRTAFAVKNITIDKDDETERLLEMFKCFCAENSEKNALKIKLLGEDQSQIADIILRLRRVLNDLKGASAVMDLLGINLDNYLIREQLERNAESNTNDAEPKIKEPSIVDQVFGYMLDDSDSRYESPDTFYNGKHNSVVKPIRDKLSELHDTNDEFAPYIERYPNYRLLRVLHQAGIAIQNVNLFLRNPKWTEVRTYDPDIDQYEKILIECSRNIVNPSAALPTDL